MSFWEGRVAGTPEWEPAASQYRWWTISSQGTPRTFTIVSLAAPGVPVQFVAAIVDCDGTTVRGNLVNAPYSTVAEADALRATGQFRVVTPDQLISDLKAAPVPYANLYPLVGGMPIDLAWSSLRLLEREVLPAFA